MAAGTNSVGVFLADGTYVHVGWNQLVEVIEREKFVAFHVLHHQSTDPTRLPNRVIFNGRDVNGVQYKPVEDALVVWSIEYPGVLGSATIKQSKFFGPSAAGGKARTQEIEQSMINWEVEEALGSAAAVHSELSWQDDNYDALNDAAVAHSLRAEAVPSSGTYYTFP